MRKVKAAVMSAPGTIEIREFPYPEIEDGALVMKMELAGICGTDKHSYRGELKLYVGTEIETEFRYPVIPGHENVGTVAEIGGEGRTDYYGRELKVGDRIVMCPDVICGNCLYCRDAVGYGFPWCENKENYGVTLTCEEPPHLFGGWSEYLYVMPDVFVYKVPDGLSPERAVLAEFMSVFYGLDKTGDTVVVQGVGPLGICQVIKARILGAGKIIAVDPLANRLELARELGADYTVNVDEVPEVERIRMVKELTGGHGADLVVECAGVPQAVIEGMEMLRRGGKFIEIGNYVDLGDVPINPHRHLCTKSIRLIGVSNHPYGEVGPALDLMATHPLAAAVDRVVTHKFRLEDAEKALKKSMEPDAMKVVIAPQEG